MRSTSQLEKECRRNLEVLGLMKRLAPDFKTLANFRQQNSQATRHFNEGALNRSQQRVDENPGLMRLRGAVVERPFAQLKQNMGMRRFVCLGKSGAESEMGLAVMAYNLNRMINALGVQKMLQLI